MKIKLILDKTTDNHISFVLLYVQFGSCFVHFSPFIIKNKN